MEMENEETSSVSAEDSDDRMVPINPAPFIKSLFGQTIIVKLKWGMEYIGILSSADAYMNLALSEAEEYIDGESQGVMSRLMVRCNNILYIREKDAEDSEEA